MPVFPTPAPTPWLLPTLAPPLMPTFPPPPTFTFPTYAPPTLAIPTFTPPTLQVTPPTLEPLPTPIALPIFPTPALQMVPEGRLVEFSADCGSLMDAEIGPSPVDFAVWALALDDLEPPPALADFWTARVSQYIFQVEVLDDDTMVEVGPNPDTQGANEREMDLVAAMSPGVRDILLDGGCLTEIDVLLGREFLAARARLEGRYGQSGAVTVEEFAEACRDMKATSPTFNSINAIPAHLLHWWERLVPPPGLEGYHRAVPDFYREWVRVGDDPEEVDVYLQLAPVEEAQKLDGDTLETLLRTRCAG